jgi:hypothetical protein
MSANQRILFDQATSTVCLNNGITKQQFFASLHEIKRLEMCHFNFASPIMITGMSQFKNLTSLCIVAQDIEEMSGMQELVHLEELWVCETRVTRISGLDKLHALTKLFLYVFN